MSTPNITPENTDTLKAFLEDELKHVAARLDQLKVQLKENDFKVLQEELKEKVNKLASLGADDTRLFLLRREISMLSESAESKATRQSWRTRIPTLAWVAIVSIPILIYIVWISVVQKQSQPQIHSFATQTAAVIQVVPRSTEIVATVTQTPTP